MSKRRDQDVIDPQEVVTRYYLTHEKIAEDLAKFLPRLVQPDTWKSTQKTDALGNVLKVSSWPLLIDAQGQIIQQPRNGTDEQNAQAFVMSRAVLIIHQTRAVHEEIAEVIRRVEQGDPGEKFGAGGLGCGGFGSGFFSTRPPQRVR